MAKSAGSSVTICALCTLPICPLALPQKNVPGKETGSNEEVIAKTGTYLKAKTDRSRKNI
jgi:hypothetical protein